MVTDPYYRYKVALQEIAAGGSDPVAIAKEALRSRVRQKKPIDPSTAPRSRESHHADRVKERIEFFERWVEAGQPGATKYSLQLGCKPERVRRMLAFGAWHLCHPSRKDHQYREIAERLRQ